jgi:hypothetical protein
MYILVSKIIKETSSIRSASVSPCYHHRTFCARTFATNQHYNSRIKDESKEFSHGYSFPHVSILHMLQEFAN